MPFSLFSTYLLVQTKEKNSSLCNGLNSIHLISSGFGKIKIALWQLYRNVSMWWFTIWMSWNTHSVSWHVFQGECFYKWKLLFSELADFYDTLWLDLVIKLIVISHYISQLTVKVPGHKKLLGSFHMPLWEQTHSVHTVFRRFSCVKNLCTADYRGSPFYACLTLYSCVRQIYLMQ